MSNFIDLTCEQCKLTFTVLFKNRKRRFCCHKCCTTYYSGTNNPSYGKTYRTKKTHPEWAEKISKTNREIGVNVGDKNAMKRPEVAEKMSKTRREKVTSDPEYRKARSISCRQNWADGKYDGVRVGQCEWHTHIKSDGTLVKLQGTWELAYAQWLDFQGIEYDTHKGRIPYLDDDGKERSYYPDFFLVRESKYIDVKNPYYEKVHARKIELVRQSNPGLTLEILGKEKLLSLGLDIK
jgi:hypothetical protein